MSTEAEKSQDMPLASWRLRGANAESESDTEGSIRLRSQPEDPQAEIECFLSQPFCPFRPCETPHTEDGHLWLQGENKDDHGSSPGSIAGTVFNALQITALSFSQRGRILCEPMGQGVVPCSHECMKKARACSPWRMVMRNVVVGFLLPSALPSLPGLPLMAPNTTMSLPSLPGTRWDGRATCCVLPNQRHPRATQAGLTMGASRFQIEKNPARFRSRLLNSLSSLIPLSL